MSAFLLSFASQSFAMQTSIILMVGGAFNVFSMASLALPVSGKNLLRIFVTLYLVSLVGWVGLMCVHFWAALLAFSVLTGVKAFIGFIFGDSALMSALSSINQKASTRVFEHIYGVMKARAEAGESKGVVRSFMASLV